jgi:hypothetical protein
VTSLNSESFKKARVAHKFWFQDLDGNVSKDDFVMGSPNLAHTADRDAIDKSISISVYLSSFWFH